ncbi:oligosaccharide flippase family protein [Lacinutrix sp. Hel_I_90]|uniref:oligosaccharide flippase family protein n=1 Tax=Lacinutrix sp. Hel_I_90 TaxID=1249999 RepID=UPI0005C8D5CF|nr:oligosaccharide flippase family protein [Lacinutrix sp. Hel_I_90]
MDNSQKSYGQILKATSLFGGVQVISILAGVLRSKFAAVFIGVAGIGLLGILNSTLNLIVGVSKLGLDASSIKEIAFINKSSDLKAVSKTVYVLKRLLWLTGLIGTLLTMALSPVLSEIAFDSKDYTFSFIWISIAVLFKQLTYGELAILQGLRLLRKLALVNLYGSLISVVIAVPLYYFFGIDGIVPTIILSAFFGYIIARYFSVLFANEGYSLSLKQMLSEGKPMLKLGVTLSISSLITLLVAYIIQLYITNTGGLTEVGYYNAGIIIINSYIGIIFQSMSKDYFPRLSEVVDDNNKVRETVTQQATIAVLLVTPVVIVFLVFSKYVIKILYSAAFLPTALFLNFAIMGILFKAVSWSMGYVIIANGDSKIFIKTAIAFNCLLLAINMLGYSSYGLEGLGMSFVVYYFIHLIVIGIIMKKYYDFVFPKTSQKTFFLCLLMIFITFGITYIELEVFKIVLLTLAVIASISFTLYKLNKVADLKTILKTKFRK